MTSMMAAHLSALMAGAVVVGIFAVAVALYVFWKPPT